MANDGGSAFPEIMTDVHDEHGNAQSDTYSFGGMSLRDYFAAKAMQGILSNSLLLDRFGLDTDSVVKDAYVYADALLEARLKGKV